jgi:hypothetical protein
MYIMDNSSLQNLKDILAKSDTIGIAVGPNPTIDEMGGALALYLALQSQHKQVSIASPTEPIVELSNLVGIDKVRPSLGGGTPSATGDLVVSFPYHEGEIEKVSYTIDNGFLNIVVKAGERGLTFQEQDVRFTRGGGTGGTVQALFVIGAANLSDLGPLYNPDSMKDTTVINIDNKSENQGYGDLVLVSPRFSSVSEQVADMLYGLGIDVDVDMSQNLMSGISFATGNFQSPNTSSLAFEMAALLMRKGAMREPVRSAAPAQQQQFMRQPVQPRVNQQPPMPQQAPMPQPQAQQPMQQRTMPNPSTPATNAGQAGVSGAQDPQEAIRQALRNMQTQQQTAQTPPSGYTQQSQPSYQQPDTSSAQPSQTPADSQMNGRADQYDQKPPSDWLTPKVYKGSTSV